MNALKNQFVGCLPFLVLVACSDSDSPAVGGAATGGAGPEGGGGAAASASIEIHLRASTAPFNHQDGLAGQTPTVYESGIRSLRLLRAADDPDPVTVFDLGQGSVSASYADGADTLVYTARARDLPKATFTVARVVHAWTRYQIDATMHTNGLAAPGSFDNLQVLSDGTEVEGVVRDAGYFEYSFTTAGMTFPVSGSDAPVPAYQGAGGFSVRVENGEYAFYFPVDLPVDPDLTTDLSVVFLVNTHEAFRWEDQATAGFTDGVFDTTPTTFEPVKQLGANSFTLSLE